jgi:predicted phage terminase large subunit-like protein
MSTRLNDPKTGIRIIVMQRLHTRDLSGHLLAQGGWEQLILPAEYDGVRRKTSLGEYDPRTKQGELLWPELYDAKALAPIKVALGAYGVAGQLQQRPSPAGGGIIKIKDIKLWPYDKQLPPLSYLVQSYDTAFSEKTQNDPSACTVWGITQYNKRTIAILMDAWAEHLAYPELRARMIEDWRDTYGGDPTDIQNNPKKSDMLLIEAKASGQSLLQDLRQANLPVRRYNPGKADKISRAHSIAPLIESGCVYVMESRKTPGKPVSWAKMVLDQLEVFPAGEHDDLVDSCTQALIYLRDSGFLELEVYEEDAETEEDYSHKRGNPYAM